MFESKCLLLHNSLKKENIQKNIQDENSITTFSLVRSAIVTGEKRSGTNRRLELID